MSLTERSKVFLSRPTRAKFLRSVLGKFATGERKTSFDFFCVLMSAQRGRKWKFEGVWECRKENGMKVCNEEGEPFVRTFLKLSVGSVLTSVSFI